MTTTENGAEPLLRLEGVSKNFGPVQALSDIDFEIPAGQVTALIGDNGAGKSVTIKTIAGIHGPEHGKIFWEGKPVRIRTPREAAALGIETVYQDLALCNNLDIVQNMFLGRERVNSRVFLDEESMEKAAGETLSSLAVTTVRGDDVLRHRRQRGDRSIDPRSRERHARCRLRRVRPFDGRLRWPDQVHRSDLVP